MPGWEHLDCDVGLVETGQDLGADEGRHPPIIRAQQPQRRDLQSRERGCWVVAGVSWELWWGRGAVKAVI